MGKISTFKRLTNLRAYKGNASDSSKSFAEKSFSNFLKQCKLLLTVIAVLVSFSLVKGQTASSYTLAATSGTYVANVTPTATSLAATTDGGISTAFNIGFSFTFAGTSYTQVQATSDGVLLFGTGRTQTLTNNLATTTATQRPGVAPLWDDLQCTAGVNYKLTGTSPNQVLTVEWPNMEWNWNSVTAVISFQVKLYEGSNQVQFVYNQNATAVSSGSASIGLMGTSSSDFLSLTSSGAAPTTSTSTSTNTISTKPASGQIYTFTPGAVVPPPANDNCAGATAFGTILTDGTCTTLSNRSTANATASGVTPTGACTSTSGTADDDVWFSFVAPGPSVVLSSTFVSGVTDVYWHVFSGSCSTTMTSVFCTDNNSGGTLTGLTTGATYYIRLYTWSSAVTTVQNICLSTPPPPPANDLCSDAIALPCGTSSLAGTTVNTLSETPPITGLLSGYGVWYKFTGDGQNSTITVSGGTLDAEILVVSGTTCGAAYTQVADVDNALTGGTETATFTTTNGLQYYVYIAYYSTSGTATNTGTFNISRSCSPPPPPTTLVPASGNATVTTCNATIQDNGGTPTYASNSNGYLVINPATPNTLSRLTFSEINTESGFDYLTVYDGAGTSGTVLFGPASGIPSLPTVTSLTGSLTVLFTSDGSVNNAGFTAIASCYSPPVPNCLAGPTAPADGAIGVAVTGTILSWPSTANATGYDVYFDEAASATTLVSSNQAGTSYLIPGTLNSTALHSWKIVPKGLSGDASGCATWSFTTANTPPAQDQCGGAKIISSNAGTSGPTLTGTFTNINCTNTNDPANTCQPASDRGLWWSFTPDVTAAFSFSTCSSVTATTVADNVLGIFTSSDGTCSGTFTQVACNDNAGATCSNSLQSIISNQILTGGTTYYILAYANGSANTGNIQIQVTRSLISPTLTAAPGATVDNQFDITFTSDVNWESSVTDITVGGISLPASAYTVSNGIITLKPSESALLQASGSKNIVVSATGYTPASVTQQINPGVPANLTVSTQPAAPTVSGGAFATQPRVTVRDQYNNLVLAGITINAQVNPTQTADWSLGGSTSATTNASGIAIFSGLTAANLTTAVYTGATIIFTPGTGSGNAQSNPFNLPIPPPAYDICSGAVEIPCDGSVTLNNSLATIDALPGVTCGSTTSTIGTNKGIWLKVTPTVSGSMTVATCGTSPSTDTYLRIYSGTCGALTACMGSNDDGCSPMSTLAFTATANTTYYVLCGLYSSSTTAGNITISATCPVPPPANDICSNAIGLTINGATCTTSTPGTTIAATQSLAGCAGTADDDVWYTFTATAASHVVTVTPGTLYDAVLQVFSGTCSGLTSLGCTDATGSFSNEVATLTGLNIGQTYYVRVYSYENNTTYPEDRGTFSICVTTPPPSITVSPATLAVTGYNEGTGPLTTSASTFTVSGSNLLGDISLSTPADYEIATAASGTFGTSLSFTPTNGTVSATTIYVRLIGGLTIGTYNSEILTATSQDAVDKTVTLNSAVYLPNNDCAGATELPCGGTVTDDYNLASNDVLPGVTCGSTTVGLYKGLWYTLSPTVSGSVTVSSCASFGTDTYLRIYEGTCGSFTACKGSNDDASGACSTGTLFSSVTFTATAGTTYYVFSSLYSASSTAGQITLTATCPIPAPVANDITICDDNFTAKWSKVDEAFSYQLDVSTSSTFNTFISGYNNLSVTGTSQLVTVPSIPGTYYYRVRAVRGSVISLNSNTATVQVNSSPVITCPANISVNTTTACGANVNFAASATGTPAPTIDYSTTEGSVASGDFFPVGITTITALASNSCNESSCEFTITVTDAVAPVATCQDVTVQLDATGNGSTTADDVNNGSSDACGIASLALSQTAFVCSEVGANTETLTVTDENGNVSTCTTTITVVDGVAPVATCQDVTVQLDASGNGLTTADDVNNGSSDACGIASLSLSQTAFVCNEVGANTETLTVTDVNGNISTCTTTITVVDGIAPIATCQDVTVQLDATGNGSTTADDVNNGSSDACGIASLVLSQTAFICSEVGANTETLTVTDANGNVSTCTTTITVVDGIAPVATCQDVTVQLDASGNGSTNADDVNNGSSDACGIASISLSQTSFVCSEVGANTETLTVTDVNSNTSTCTTTITVQDNEAPIATCQNVTVQLDASGNGSTTADDVNNGSSDACGIASLSLSQTAFVCSEVGANTETLTVTDVNGNESTCTVTITVVDGVAPVATCQNVTVQLDATGNGSTTADDVNNGSSDACGIFSLSLSQLNFSCSEVGANTETLTVTDVNGNESTCTATITVADGVAPVAVCKDITIDLTAGGSAVITASSVNDGSSDACGIASLSVSQTAFNCSEVGPNEEVLTVTDVNGNISTCATIVTVEDNVAPQSLCQNVTVHLDASGYGSTTPQAVNNGSTDACGLLPQCLPHGPMVTCLSGLSLDKATFNCGNIGANTVILTATDNHYNSATCEAIVTVVDDIAPVALCQNVTVQLNASGTGSTDAASVNNGSSDACGIASLTLNKTTFNCGDVGTKTVTLTVVDVNGNISSCNSTVTIQDNVAPIAVCKDVTLTLTSGTATITASSINNGSSDACGIASLVASPTVFGCSNIGGNTATLTVTDVNGNVSTCTSTVTINGVVPSCSIASVPTSTVYTGGNNNVIYLGYGAQSTRLVASVTGGSGFTYSWTGSNLSSNSVSNPIFTPTAPGTYNFSVTITNSNGCVTSCSITICVVDIRVPGTGGKKVYVCHTESSSPNTLQISVNGVAAHLAHGDYLGSCGTSTVCNPRPFTKDQSGSQSVAKEITTETVTVTEKSIVNEVKVNAYPNPFKYNTTIAFTLPEASENVTLSVFNIEGREVKQLYNGSAKGQQEYQFQLNVTDEMQSGLYFYRLQTKEGKVVVNKLILTK